MGRRTCFRGGHRCVQAKAGAGGQRHPCGRARRFAAVLRIGFAGSGLIAWTHAIGIKAMIQAGVIDGQITAVYDSDDARAAGFAEVTGAESLSSLDQLMAHCDALWVCTPTVAHTEAVTGAVAAGRAVFCEKPLATQLKGAHSLAEAVAASGVPAQVGLVLRSAPVFRALRDLVTSEDLGRPMAAVFRDDQYFPIQGVYGSTWRGDSERAGGGCLIEHSIHDVDILRFCLGEVAEVAGTTANLSGKGDVEDVASVSLRFASGASANLTSVWHDIMSRGSSRRLELFFERGMAWLENDFRGPLHVQTSDGPDLVACPSPVWVDDLPLKDDDVGLALRAYVEADRAFVDAITEGRPPEPGLAEAVVAHELVDAAYRSAALNGAPISMC
jgi:predicted dehydrogenase